MPLPARVARPSRRCPAALAPYVRCATQARSCGGRDEETDGAGVCFSRWRGFIKTTSLFPFVCRQGHRAVTPLPRGNQGGVLGSPLRRASLQRAWPSTSHLITTIHTHAVSNTALAGSKGLVAAADAPPLAEKPTRGTGATQGCVRVQAEQLQSLIEKAQDSKPPMPADPTALSSWYQEVAFEKANRARHAPVRSPINSERLFPHSPTPLLTPPLIQHVVARHHMPLDHNCDPLRAP